MKKRLLALFVILTMLATMLVGCAEETRTDRDKRSSSSRSDRDRDDDDDDDDDDDGRSLADLIKDKINGGGSAVAVHPTIYPATEWEDDSDITVPDWYYKEDEDDEDDEAEWSPTPTPNLPKATPTPGITPIPIRDLGGMEIIIGDHWSPETPAEPTNAQEEATAKYRQEIFAKYNFTMQSKAVASWGEMTDYYIESISVGEPTAQLFDLDYRFISKPLSYGMFYDLATLDELDFSEEKWNKAVKGIMTKGNSIYGMSAAKSEPRGGLIWNKRLFEEAGLDPDLPYDLQACGEWTWSKFEEICARLTCDTNNDGLTDVYATVSQGASTLTCLVASTGSDFFLKDEYGNLMNNMGSKEVLDALDFAVDLYNKGYEMPMPEDANWDWFYAAFQEGKAAMTFNEEYTCMPYQSYGDVMEDAVGFVMPPKPDGAENYHSYVCDNITIIPSCYDSETAGNIAFAYNVYTMATPGYDDPYEWKERYYSHFEDERAVDETIVRFNDGVSTHFLTQALIDDDLGPDLLWVYPFSSVTPAEQVAAIKDSWDAIVAEANGW